MYWLQRVYFVHFSNSYQRDKSYSLYILIVDVINFLKLCLIICLI
jgi:hypothetical protein